MMQYKATCTHYTYNTKHIQESIKENAKFLGEAFSPPARTSHHLQFDEGDSTRSWHLFTSGDMVQECSTAKDPQFSEDSDNGYSYGSSSTDDDCNPAMDVDTDSG
nr:PREDICTED: uncharacterized protein LOC108211964 isoform X4 [Daucus carota subsp. sativus]